MEEQLIYTSFNPLVIELLADMKGVVQTRGAYFKDLRLLDAASGKTGRKSKCCKDKQVRSLTDICEDMSDNLGISINPDTATINSVREALEQDLKANLDEHIMDVEEIRRAIVEDLSVSDSVLKLLGDNLCKLAFGTSEKLQRKYEVIAKCTKSGCEGQLKHIIPITAEHYIEEIAFKEAWYRQKLSAGLNGSDSDPYCVKCGSHLDATSAMNVVHSTGTSPIYAVITRVKSAGRYVDKLVDLLLYDSSDPNMKKRSISDKYAFTIVLNTPTGVSDADFIRDFKRRFGISMKPNGDIGDAACYAMFEKLGERFNEPKRPPVIRQLQDDINDPKKRVGRNNQVEYYKRLQFNLHYSKIRFEGQIKTRDIWDKERDDTSAISHWTWEETEGELRQAMYMKMPEALIIRRRLHKIFPENNILLN